MDTVSVAAPSSAPAASAGLRPYFPAALPTRSTHGRQRVQPRPPHTLAAPFELTGRGVHSGATVALRCLPAPAGTGRVYARTDLPGSPTVAARAEFLCGDALLRRTTLQHGEARVFTIEHLLAACAAAQLDDVRIELTGAEMPFLDGSALPFTEAIDAAGLVVSPGTAAPVQPLVISRPVSFVDGESEFAAIPSEHSAFTFFFTSHHPLLSNQTAHLEMTLENWRREIAPARTFCFFHELEGLRRAGLIKGANLASAVVFGSKAIINSELRFPDEPARHKLLDLVGDLALLARPIAGHILAWRGGHKANAAFAQFLESTFPAHS